VREVRGPTPLQPADGLVDGRTVLLKREDVGPNGAFKWRGAICALTALRRDGVRSVVTSSTGNHGAATAWAADRLDLEAHVVVPEGANEEKCALIRSHGAHLHVRGAGLDESTAYARELTGELDGAFFEDGASEAQLHGTETIGAELLDVRPAAVVAPLACGALAGGIGRAFAGVEARPRIIGVQSTAYNRLGAILRGEPDPVHPRGTSFADGLADNRIVEPAFSACRRFVDEVVEVDDDALRETIRDLHRALDIVVEGAAAAPLAALRLFPEQTRGERVVAIVSGRNLDPSVAEEILGS
jgi:threonine dehydratase